jgi:hypothetical protein
LAFLMSLGACADQIGGTNQLYLGQAYLPLPERCRDEPESCGFDAGNEAPVAAAPAPASAGGPYDPGYCVVGAVMARRPIPEERRTVMVLPGMKLHVDQTTYRSNSSGAVPVLSQWEWRVPTPEACSDLNGLSVPQWEREDLLVVRHLLSSAQLRSKSESTPPLRRAPHYFDSALAKSGDCGEMPAARCLQLRLLHPFVRGLHLDIREMVPRSPAPGAVRSDAEAGAVTQAAGLGRWMSSLFAPRKADFELRQANPDCARHSQMGEQAATQKHCTFAFASLGWSSRTLPLPGELLEGYSRLDLIRTGDALLAMRPQRFQIPLDPADRELPPCSEEIGSPQCLLLTPMVQGFTDIRLAIPVITQRRNVVGSDQLVFVPVGTSVDAFQLEHGRVRQVLRAEQWLPERVALADGKWTLRRKLANKRGRIALHFPKGDGSRAGRGLIVREAARADVLLAPGDIVVLDLR